jgi:hypothetical protein
MAIRIIPKVDGKIGREDFGPLAHSPFVHDWSGPILVFRGQDGKIDYDNHVAVMQENDTQLILTNHKLPPNTIWHYVRCRVAMCCGKRSDPSPPCIVRIDADGNMIGLSPNAPFGLMATPLAGGKIKVRWQYSRYRQEIPPTGFRIYMCDGGPLDFTNDLIDSVDYGGSKHYTWLSDELLNGTTYKFTVRAYRSGEGESQNTNFVSATADSEGPPALSGLILNYSQNE